MPRRRPRRGAVDSALALSREGYTFIPNRSRRYGSDAFEVRLMLRKAVCMTGEVQILSVSALR